VSVSLSATVAIPGIPRFYKSNTQGSNKSVSIIPDFLNGLYLSQNERSGQSEVEYTLLGVKREESKSILLENTFIYGVDTSLWSANCSFQPTTSEFSYGYCSILNSYRTTPNPIRATNNSQGYLIKDRRIRGNQILANTRDVTYDPATLMSNASQATVPASTLTTFNKEYVCPVIYHNAQGSNVTLEGWLEPYITPFWADIPGDYCGNSIYTTPFDATLSLETTKTFRYEPGKASTFTMGIKVDTTGGIGVLDGNIVKSQASWGARNDTDTYRFVLEGDGNFSVERLTPYAETCLKVYRKDFIDPLDGTGPSGITIDFTKVTMYSIEFSWYGAIGANFYVYVPVKRGESKWIKIAALLSSNRYTKPALSSPNMRLFTELYIPMGCTQLQTMSLYGSSVYIDGNFRDTLKYFTSSAMKKSIDQKPRTYITLEVPNFLDGQVFRPKNNANDFPKILNGISTQDAQIDIYESTSGGSPDILTAYYETSQPVGTGDSFLLLSNITNGNTRQITISANITEDQKIDFMRRIVNNYLVLTNPVTSYQPYTFGGGSRTQAQSGAKYFYEASIIQAQSNVNSKQINLFLDTPIYNQILAYTSTNVANIALRNSLAATYPVIGTYPSIPLNSNLFALAQMPANNIITTLDTGVNNNRSFVITRKPIKSGIVSFDTDLLTLAGSNSITTMNGIYGIISESAYQKIQNNNHYLTELNVSSTNVQTVSTSPKQEFIINSELYWGWRWGRGGSGINNPAALGFPGVPPFRVNGVWQNGELPVAYGSYIESKLWTINPLVQNIGSKIDTATLFDDTSFTNNIDIREHEFYLYGSGAQLTTGPNTNYTYIKVILRSKDLFSIEDGIPVNNLYNFKLLIYGHNGQMSSCLTNRAISSIKKNWSSNSAVLQSIVLGLGTSYNMSDALIETDGSLYYTVGFPKSSTADINAFLASPNIKFNFKSVFLRNIAYRSPLSVQYKDRNAGLWYGTFFISTLEPVHIFVFLSSKNATANNYPQQLYQSVAPLSRPMITNFQYYNARDKLNIPISETPVLNTINTTLVTQVTCKDVGVLYNLPAVNFSFEKVTGINTRVDENTCQVLNSRYKDRKFTFLINKGIPFTYDLSTFYNPSRYILTPLTTSILNRDFKRFFVTAKTIKNESFATPWFFSLNDQTGSSRTPFAILNPKGTDYDAAIFSINNATAGPKNVYIANTLKTAVNSDQYFIWSIYAKSISPALSAGRFIVFELRTGESNSIQRWQPVAFDIIENRIGFGGGGTSTIAGRTDVWQNAYDKVFRRTLVFNNELSTNTNWFSAAKSTSFNTKISGFSCLANKENGRYVVAAHIEDVGDGWKRLSTCTYYKNNHNDNVIYIGNYTGSYNTFGNVSLWGFQEESVALDSTIDSLSSWYPSTYNPVSPGNITFNLTTGEQL